MTGRARIFVGLLLIFSANSASAAVVSSYDGFFSVSIPEKWELASKDAFKENLPAISVAVKAETAKNSGGLVITELAKAKDGSSDVSLRELAKRDLAQIRAGGLSKNRPSAKVRPVRIKRDLPWGYTFITANGRTGETVVYFSFEGRDYKAVCANSQRRQCRKILATISRVEGAR